MRFQREVARIEEANIGTRDVAPIGFGSGRQEEWVVASPDRQQRRLTIAEISLELRIERDVAGIVEHQWFRGFVDEFRGKPLPAMALKKLEPLNQLLARDEEFGQIVARDRKQGAAAPSGLQWEMQRRWDSTEVLLIPVAKAMADLVCSEDFSDVKGCEGQGCTLFFLDKTRARARRWCSMAICGNRAKQAAHRKRAKRRRTQRTRK